MTVLALISHVLGCSSEIPAGPMVTIERTGCYGSCPIFILEIGADGALKYEGKQYVKTEGSAFGRLSPQELAMVRHAFREAKFDQLPEDCCNCEDVTDFASALITYVDGNSPKTIKHYFGCFSAPDSVRHLESKIFNIVAIEQWIGKENGSAN